jgi:uncharacterized protein
VGTTFLVALGLALVIEGLLPFFHPTMWRGVFAQIARMSDGQIRSFGLMSMLVGIALMLVGG